MVYITNQQTIYLSVYMTAITSIRIILYVCVWVSMRVSVRLSIFVKNNIKLRFCGCKVATWDQVMIVLFAVDNWKCYCIVVVTTTALTIIHCCSYIQMHTYINHNAAVVRNRMHHQSANGEFDSTLMLILFIHTYT